MFTYVGQTYCVQVAPVFLGMNQHEAASTMFDSIPFVIVAQLRIIWP